MLKKFKELSEREIPGAGRFRTKKKMDGFSAKVLRTNCANRIRPTAQMFEEMREEEAAHRDPVISQTFRERFGDPHSADPARET